MFVEGRVFTKVPTVKEGISASLLDKIDGVEVELGGWWRPKHCQPRWRVAIVIPYR